MKLFKNVDICDLESILEKGILSINKSGNDNWYNGKRANNSIDLVYLFKPLNKGDSFPKYGVALIECEVDATQNEINIHDINFGKYEEYVTEKVDVKDITDIYIPEIFIERLSLPEEVFNKITWCGMNADDGHIKADTEILKQFAKTAELKSSNSNFFRGVKQDRTMIDLYNVRYIF